MSLPSLPSCPGAVDHSLPDPEWTSQHKHWLPATVWAAQHASRERQLDEVNSSKGRRRCAACAEKAPFNQKCSKCRLVFFCNKDCQRAAFPVHKHFCQPHDKSCLHSGEIYSTIDDFRAVGAFAYMEQCLSHPITPDMPIEAKSGYAWQALACGENWRKKGDQRAFKAFERSLQLGVDLKHWTLQSESHKGLVVSCIPLGVAVGRPVNSEHNQQYWNAALAAGRRHQDIYLEALTLKNLGIMRVYHYKDNKLLQESYEAWIALMKACRMKGPVGERSLAICGTNTHMALSALASSMDTRNKAETTKVESLLREALLYADMAPDEPSHWPYRYPILMQLANTCELSDCAMEAQGGTEWREKAAIYRQHAANLSKRMGTNLSDSCGYCKKPLGYKQPTEYLTFGKSAVNVNTCGHMHHMLCQKRAHQSRNTKCPSCH